MIIDLLKFSGRDHPFGNGQGKEVFRMLVDFVDQHPTVRTFGVSLAGIVATDASFPRESVIALAKHLRGEKGIFLIDLHNRDVIDNWNYAAKAKEQPIVIWRGDEFEVIGPELTQSGQALLEFVLRKGSALASEAAAELNVSVPSASTRLKKLVEEGYIRRVEAGAESGGIEFKYEAIR